MRYDYNDVLYVNASHIMQNVVKLDIQLFHNKIYEKFYWGI